jgi:hypothetical protein
VVTLPITPESERLLRGLVQEIREMTGTAYLFRSALIGDETVITAARDAEYGEVIGICRDFRAEFERERRAANFTFAELEENEEELAKLVVWIAKIIDRDYFTAGRRGEAEQAIAFCREDLERFAQRVYAAVDCGSADPGAGKPLRSIAREGNDNGDHSG